MAVYVVNDFYTTPKRYEGLNGTSTVEEVAEGLTKYDPTSCGRTESGTIYFEFPSDEEWLKEEVLEAYFQERARFIHFFVRGFEDQVFYGYGFDDQRNNHGYEEGHVLGMNAPRDMEYGDASDIAQILWEYVVREENR